MEDLEWKVQKICTDSGDYELVVEKQKTDWECDQERESWKWAIDYHGSIVASGVTNSVEEAKNNAAFSVPKEFRKKPC